MSDSPGIMMLPETVPLFPLPNVVLFPRAVLPLHIFEDRYRRMMADVLQSHRMIAMALLRPGWEKDYQGRPAIHEVVCVGRILNHEKLVDGRFNLLLEGRCRAVVQSESTDHPYRLARLKPLQDLISPAEELRRGQAKLRQLFNQDVYCNLPGGRQFREIVNSDMCPAVMADLLAFHILGEECVEFRQTLLSEPDATKRLWSIISAVESLRPAWANLPKDPRCN